MRGLLRLALVLSALAAAAGSARGDRRSAMSTREGSFELFGTSVCFGEGRCDVQLARSLLDDFRSTPEPKAKVWHVLGLSFCTEPHATGPACDVVWVPPMSTALAWSEIRMGMLPSSF
jgi:hypothetical protein